VPQHRLLLIRHARAADGQVDADRPLTGHGLRQAAAIGTWLVQAGMVPDGVLVSPARRAAQTWGEASAALEPGRPPIVDSRLYDNTVEALLAAVRETSEGVRTLAVVGHNPSVAELARTLGDGRGDRVARRAVEAGFPAGGVAVFDLAAPFADVTRGSATLTDFRVPGD